VDATEARAANGTFYNDPGLSYSYALNNSATLSAALGCNYQLPRSPLVLGLEAEVGTWRLRGSAVDPNSVPAGSDTVDSTKVGNWFGILAGRFGVTIDRSLLYAKAGLARVDVESNIVDTCGTFPCGAALLTASGSQRDTAWVIGAGLEYALSSNWTIRGEYLRFEQLDDYQVCGPVTVGGATVAQVCSRHDVDPIHTLKVGISYRFGG
jgi:outer membrane immunogenic protein